MKCTPSWQPSEQLMSVCQFWLAGERVHPHQVVKPATNTTGRHHLIQTLLTQSISLVSKAG